ncbi:unnamed protein product [Macrosiphum euphorbiae]|uniref:Uncharacterized protein n=1 Tax=Macrosiphum euphorbiae TaxID=13131 RepID=A0AAV0W0I2_9HEMI|nr:unnamed protein product [Macrosiphum euphorbiae]
MSLASGRGQVGEGKYRPLPSCVNCRRLDGGGRIRFGNGPSASSRSRVHLRVKPNHFADPGKRSRRFGVGGDSEFELEDAVVVCSWCRVGWIRLVVEC